MKKKEEVQLTETQEQVIFEDEPRSINYSFCSDWKLRAKGTEKEIREYIAAELEKLIESNDLVLSSVLAHSSHLVKTIALQIFPQFRLNSFKLKIVDKERLPVDHLSIHDPNGAVLPPAKRGKVIALQTGLRGDMDFIKDQEHIDTDYSGIAFKNHQKIARLQYGYKKAPYLSAEVGFEPKEFNQNEAVAILSRYGFAIGRKEKEWLVEEV